MKTVRITALGIISAVHLWPAIQYAGGTNVNTTFTTTTGTKQEIVDGLAAALTTAGWTTVSGGGTADVVMQTATTPQGLAARLRIFAPGSGNCTQLFGQNANGSIVATLPIYLLPTAGRTFRVIANRYQFFVFTEGTPAAREFAAGGVPYVPSFVAITEAFWLQGNAESDTDTTVRGSFRTALTVDYVASTERIGTTFQLVNGNSWSQAGAFGGGTQPGYQSLVSPSAQDYTITTAGYQWFDGSAFISEPLIAWGITDHDQPSRVMGQLWDAVIVSDSFSGDSSITFDSRTWYAITNSNTGGNGIQGRGTLFVMVP